MLKGKTVLLGVTGSIAAYKIAYLASALKKLHAQVHVLMTQNATNFINPITFETLTGNKCLVDTFDRNFQFSVEHVSIAKQADVVMIAPASANVIGKLAHGIADDMLTTTIMACKCKKIVSPAMNTNMYENPIVQDNLAILQHYGYEVIEPASGYLACGDTGAGKMPEPEMLLDYILREIAKEKDLLGRKVLVTAGLDTGGNRSCTLYYESFFRKDGICTGKSSYAPWGGCNTGQRTMCNRTATVCKACSGSDGKGNV